MLSVQCLRWYEKHKKCPCLVPGVHSTWAFLFGGKNQQHLYTPIQSHKTVNDESTSFVPTNQSVRCWVVSEEKPKRGFEQFTFSVRLFAVGKIKGKFTIKRCCLVIVLPKYYLLRERNEYEKPKNYIFFSVS